MIGQVLQLILSDPKQIQAHMFICERDTLWLAWKVLLLSSSIDVKVTVFGLRPVCIIVYSSLPRQVSYYVLQAAACLCKFSLCGILSDEAQDEDDEASVRSMPETSWS